MTPESLQRFLSDLDRQRLNVTHLDPATGYAYLRNLIEPASFWTLILNPEDRMQMELLKRLPNSDHRVLQPITLRDPGTCRPLTARILLIELWAKSRLSREMLVAAIMSMPMQRPDRRRMQRELNRGRDFIAFGNDLGDCAAIQRVLKELAAAALPA